MFARMLKILIVKMFVYSEFKLLDDINIMKNADCS